MRGMSKKDALACQVSLGLFAGLLGIASTAHGAPIYDGGTLAADGKKAGNVTIDTATANTTKITSTQPNNVIGWKDFSIKSTEIVEFDGGVTTGTTAKNYLNIVTGNVTSHIDGEMKGGNNVYIANSHGVIFGKGASVDVGNLYVTTQDLTGVDYSQATNSSKIGAGTVIDTPANGKAAASAKADVVSLVDTSGKNLQATKIVLEGKSVRIMNDENIKSGEVYTLANTDPLEVAAGGTKTVRPYTGYVHVGHTNPGIPSNPLPTVGAAGKYKNLTGDNLYNLIGSEYELEHMELNKNYMLRSNIALTGTHTPIGTSTDPFKGRFDGMFHEITGLTLGAGTATEYVGLFGTTDGATIMNVGLKNANLSSVDYGGGLVGHAKGKTVISAVYNESTAGIGHAGYAGGLVGWLDSSSLDHAYNTAKVDHGGGLVGQFDGSSKMYAVYNTGEVTSGVSSSAYMVYGSNVVTTGTDSAFIKEAYTNRVELTPSVNNNIIYNSYTIDSTGKASLVIPSGTAQTGDPKQAATYADWDISDEGGANKTWRIFAGQSTPLLTAFMKGTVQAEYSYADFQQTGHAHLGNTASTYTVQAEDNKSTGSTPNYVKREGKSNGGKDITERTYNADYLKIAKKNGDGSYSVVTSVGTTDDDITLRGINNAADRNLVQLNQGTSGGGRRNAGKEAMLVSGQHGYDIAGANVTIEKRKVIGEVAQMGKIEREYDGTENVGNVFKKAITAGDVSLRTEGLVDGDGATMTISNDAATFHNKGDWSGTVASKSKDAGYNKAVYIDSSKVSFGDAEGNYEFDATKINDKHLTGNILQKTIKAKLTTDTGIDKTYDGTSKVLKAQYQPNPNLVLDSSTPLVGTNDVTLNQADVTVKYKDKTTKAEVENAGTGYGVAYEGIKLKSTTAGMTKNYKLVDKEGNVLYREAIDDDPNAAAAVTSGGTLWGTGTIERRKLDASHFSITGASKIYDGKDYLLVDGTEHKVEVAVNEDAGTAADTTQKGLVERDKNNLQFTISAADGKAYYKNASNANTKDVYSTTSPNGAQFLSYTLKASGSALENYAFDDGATTQDLTTAGTYDIKNTATIKPRDITVDLLKKTGIDKVYDKTTAVTDGTNGTTNNKLFGTNFGYAAGTTDDHKLVAGDGAEIKATSAVYKKKTSGLEAADKDVSRVGGTAAGNVIEDGKDVEYKIELTGADAAKAAAAAANYRLKYSVGTQTTNGTVGSAITMTGTGKITPRELALNNLPEVVRSYDRTSNVYAKQLKDKGYNSVTSDVGENVALTLGADTDVVGTYYESAAADAEKATDANYRSDGTTQISGKPAQYTVRYKSDFKPTITDGNYVLKDASTSTGTGKITTFVANSTNFKMDFGVQSKVFDGTAAAGDHNQLSKLELDFGNGQKLDFLHTPQKSYERIGEFGNEHANVDKDGNYLVIGGTTKTAYSFTFKVKPILGTNASDNYDLSALSPSADGYISMTKAAHGKIAQRKLQATLVNPQHEKVYDGTKDVTNGKGEKLTGSSIVLLDNLAPKENSGTYGDGSDIVGEYDNKNVQSNKHVVTYKLKISPNGYENDYYFVDKNNTVVTELKGEGVIKPREIDVDFNYARKTYDGTSAVDKSVPPSGTWGYTLKPHDESADMRTKVQTLLNNEHPTLNTAVLTGTYVGENGTTPQSDAGEYTDRVKYSNIQAALQDSNYKMVSDTRIGSGKIDKRTFNAADLNLDISAARKTYDGTTLVKKAGGKAEDYITGLTMNLGGTPKTYVKNTDYSLKSATYANPNVSANTGTGSVTYTISLKKSDGTNGSLLNNYEFTNLPTGYSFDAANGTLSRTVANGTIDKRKVYAHVKDVSKIYNADIDVRGGSGNGHLLSSSELVTFDNKLNGTAVDDTGLIDAHKSLNATTASYRDKTAGTGNKTVDYTLSIDSDPAIAGNYAFHDGKTGAAVPVNGSGKYVLTTTTNTINRRALKIQTQTGVTKAFDNTDVVKVGNAPSTTGQGLSFVGGDKQGSDTVDLNTTYTRVYKSKNATKTAASKKNNIKYNNIQLTGADAVNYYLADSTGKALDADTTLGFFKTAGDGEITPFQVTKNNFKLKFRTQPIKKTYDGTANVGVGDAAHNQPARWEDYITDSYVTDGGGTKLFDIDVEKVKSATYRNAGNTADDKNVGQNKKVLFNLKFSDAAQNNFDFSSDFYTPDADGNQMLSDGTYNRYTKGDIEKRVLQANLAHGTDIRKVYDGTKAADKSNLSILNFVEADKDKLTTTATFDKATATVDPGAAATNTRQITYTATLTGDAADNYAFDTLTGPASKTLTATGDIERRKVYAKVTGAREKTYDADTKVLIGGTEREGEALVSFGKSADNNKDTGLLTGYGTNKTTAAYAGANAADASDMANKRVDYTLKIDGKDADGTDYANNYVVYDAVNPNTVVYNKAAGTNLGLTTTNNKIDRAPLYLTATHATKQYDGTKTVKKPETLLNITGGWQGGEGGNLNRTGTGSYTAEYQDANVNTKGVDYKNVKIVGTGTKPAKASNYYLSYNGAKLTPSSSETYALHGTGDITKRQLTGGALKVGFKTDPIRKYYDGTADVKSPAPKTYVNNIRATYKDENNHDQTIDVKNYTVERADYLAKSADAAAKDVGKGKDVKFQFALNDGNFDYSGVTGATLGADGVYRFSQNYDRDAAGVGRGEIIGRRVALTLHLVQKVYDGTKDVKNGYYTKDAKTGKLVEHNPNLDWKKVITLDGDGKIGGDENSGFAHGEKLDFSATGEYKDANANRDPHYTGAIQPANKDVTYKMRLKDATANKNYTFQIRVVDEAGNTLKTATSQSFIDPQTGEGHMFDGLGNIWQKQLTLTKTNGWGKNYDGNANVTDAVKKGLQFDGVAQSDKGFFNFSDPANARANTFAGKLSGRYGDRAVEGSFLDTPGNTAVYKHVKRPQGNLNGTPEARDVELTGVKDALASLQTPGSVANNYFYDGDNTVYGTGVIKPLTLDLKKTWLKNGADFSKTYDGDPLAKIGGKALSPENKQAFHDKLKLSVDLGTGEKPIELDYTLYGDEKGDYEGYRPHYENLSGGHAHHGQSDANVKNSADPADTLNKDIVYKLKRINGDKAWANQAEGARYKDWELSENPSGADLRLSDAATDTHTDNKSGLRAVITPRKVEVQADAYSKIYDGTSSLTAPSLSAGELAKKQQELRSKLHVTDKEAAKMLKDDGIDFTVDTAASHFLNKDSREADADVARDAKGNVLKDAKGNVLKDGKLVEYRLQKTGDAVKQGNYELPSAALPSGVQTDTVLGTGSITPRIVRVAFDPASTAAPDKIYDGTQYAVKDGKIHSRTFKLVDAVGDEGVVAADAGDVELNQTHNVGKFASPNVKKDKNGVQAQDVTYHEGIELTNGRNKAGNYKLVKSNLKDSAKITPRPITATLKHEPIVKEYDGTETVKDFVRRTSAGKVETTLQREGNINLVDKNAKVTGISAPAQPTWEAKDKARGMTLTKAEYDNKNVGKNKRVTYDIAMNSDNYMLVDAAGSSLMSGDRKAQITSDKGQIDRRKVFVGLGKSADKVYDGNRVVRDALDDLSFTYNGTGVESPQKGLVAEEAQKVKKALRVSGVYTDDADAAKNDSEEYKHHKVRYTFEKDETRDPILANYEITTKNGNNTIDDTKGIIRRRTLNVVPDSQATYERRGNVNYTGHIEDGSKAANRGSDLTQEVKNDLQRFNSGVFTYGPTKGSVDYDTPDWNELQGWYMRDGKKTLASGAYDKNYTLNPVPARLFVAPRTDGVDRTLRPDGQVYVRASYDENDTFGAHRGSDASLAYTGTGVNYGGMKPQQGTSTNAGDAGIRQQGTGTNIGSSAGVSGAAVANGKVQGATGAVNEAARAAGAQPGTSVKPQGAQSGAAVKPQGTTGGNAALAGGTASSGGYYSPSAQPGASVKPQGAKSGAAAKPQSAASAVGSASRTGGAGSVVDRSLAAAAGVNVGSSSGAGSYTDGSSRAADRGLANALGKGVGSAGYYSGKGYSHTNDDEEEEIKKKTKASA
ncbi:YDG domain-containing protein [Selenomonas sputigena]|uniref:YDG domain-containing protein n=1 Tax=Selenomonas sputigena TaxID=69823 RepID=UPI0028ECB8EF|nr:YDG domain-containing protein [Selenomonas sputigena]